MPGCCSLVSIFHVHGILPPYFVDVVPGDSRVNATKWLIQFFPIYSSNTEWNTSFPFIYLSNKEERNHFCMTCQHPLPPSQFFIVMNLLFFSSQQLHFHLNRCHTPNARLVSQHIVAYDFPFLLSFPIWLVMLCVCVCVC